VDGGYKRVTTAREDLAAINTFPQLVRYLHDELDWPITTDDFEDLVFDYSAEDLGIDARNAAKIQEIKRLRPLSVHQPWGIFFVKFEPKQLPVVALRRILSSVALKKRASASRSDQVAWAVSDLLFISTYGEGDSREISFAHFSQDPARRSLPTLKVLGWDNLNSPLHLDAVAEKLTHSLVWPADEADVASWRSTWESAFTLRHREVVTTSRELAIRLAWLARAIRDRIGTALAIENSSGPLTRLMRAFQTSLVHDLDPDGFADVYAQTIAYGLLSARIADPEALTADDLAGHMRTNPLLRDLMQTFLHAGGGGQSVGGAAIDFDELGVSEVVDLLNKTNMEAVLRDFGDRNPKEDPVIHFYELFLKEYDEKQRLKRGVFYTPRPVVSFIVRSIDDALRTDFNLEDGLASIVTWGELASRDGLTLPDGVDATEPFVQVLDPATGTGTFLVEVIDVVYRTMAKRWADQGNSSRQIDSLWNEYVPEHLLPRLYGYELLVAPYAIAHLKIGLKLQETGYRFASDERARVFLTNSLESARDQPGQLQLLVPALALEATAVNEVKENRLFTVVIGNPPYSLMSANLGPEQRRLIDPYRYVAGVKISERGALQLEKNLQDDYVKFFRLAQNLIDRSTYGIVGLVTNHAYLDNPTLRGMRSSLLMTFPMARVLDLHGNTKRREVVPDGGVDKNIFDIQQGVAVSVFARPQGASAGRVWWGELWGTRERKYDELSQETQVTLAATPISSLPPLYLLHDRDEDLSREFESGMALDEIFVLFSTGVATARDKLAIQFTADELQSVVAGFLAGSPEDARARFSLGPDTNDWRVDLARRDLTRDGAPDQRFTRILYRPYDWRMTYYSGQPRGFHTNPRWPVMQHLLGLENTALIATKSVEGGQRYSHALATRTIADHHSVSIKEVNYVFPFLTSTSSPDADTAQRNLWISTDGGSNQVNPNVSVEFLGRLKDSLASFDGSTQADSVPDAIDGLMYVYAILHSNSYRARYAQALRTGFARIPIPGSRTLFGTLAKAGRQLVQLHELEGPVASLLVRFDKELGGWVCDGPTDIAAVRSLSMRGPQQPTVADVAWSANTVWLDADRHGRPKGGGSGGGFQGVAEEVWTYRVGGYQVCEKWLKDRKGRTLSTDDIAQYLRIVLAIAETIRLVSEIDQLIEEHGGWPLAFTST
jgi:hypothetical protein